MELNNFSKNRILVNPDEIFLHNAWDDASWTDEQISDALNIIEKNSKNKLDEETIKNYENKASFYWDEFYATHENNFFKNRLWLFTEFSEILTKSNNGLAITQRSNNATLPFLPLYKYFFSLPKLNEQKMTDDFLRESYNIFEIGCGVGNTIYPIIEKIKDKHSYIFGCDFSQHAIKVLKSNPSYDATKCHVFLCDITQEDVNLKFPFPINSIDVIILIFVLSSIHPLKLKPAITQILPYLKVGGYILIRDYGRYDLAQLRFKQGKCLGDNFYVRCDGTRAYFFTQGKSSLNAKIFSKNDKFCYLCNC
ncbi:tRNA N(3)-methylcytidine methyltransferase METTL2-like isoform X2 [Gordionus sp. m RMFG-2023]|uniref:tRNA N(3)-methylcytidine methyltransferase METTL2-like isoform X2 n=1 Tax=Gordionus sp. m RMFG-2023 TaxID=3053472 RepID=UPI0031FBDF5C